MQMHQFLACLLMVMGSSASWAQGPGINPSNRPAFSPWLNLNRQGNSAALNYFGLVRPQFTVNSSLQQLQQQASTLQQQQQQVTAPGEVLPTGHASGFLNHGKYFMNRAGTTPLSGRTGTVATTPQLTRTGPRR